MSAKLRRRVYMEWNRNIDGITERYVAVLEQRDVEPSRSRHHHTDETPERADSRRSQRVTPATSAVFINA